MIVTFSSRAALALTFFSLGSVAACGEPEHARNAKNAADDGVPVNSSSEARLAGHGAVERPDKPDEPRRDAPDDDPTQPLMTPIAPADSASPSGARPRSGKTGPVSRQECEEALDHGLDLLIGGNAQFAGVPPEMIAQFKVQARQQQGPGENPCAGKGISRAEYDCEMGATTAAEFKKCDATAKSKPKK